jgi:hypothetical protein
MSLKTKDNENDVETNTLSPVKNKRGRKSKQKLMEALNISNFLTKEKDNKKNNQNSINLNILEIENNPTEIIYNNIQTENNLNNDNNNLFQTDYETTDIITLSNTSEDPKIGKKRGRKPKGGKIIQQLSTNTEQPDKKINVILHLKCSMKDLQTYPQNENFVESYTFSSSKNELNYELISNENINTINNDKTTSLVSTLDVGYDYEDYDDDDSVCKDTIKEINKKLKQLEHNLHINNINNKRSACFWDTCEFDNPPIHIPKFFINGTYHVYGCFCSPECGVAYLMKENLDSSTKFERYYLFNNIYTKIYNYKKNIKPAPDPYHMLEKYYGNLSIQEYRSLLRNERLFLIVDKPLTKILPELHEDNDDFILNNKIIPSNNYNIKTRLQRKKQNKNLILTEKFGHTYK